MKRKLKVPFKMEIKGSFHKGNFKKKLKKLRKIKELSVPFITQCLGTKIKPWSPKAKLITSGGTAREGCGGRGKNLFTKYSLRI